MQLTKSVVEHLGKVFLNLAQGIILGTFISGFLRQEIPLSVSIGTFGVGVYTIFVGLYFISESRKLEE